MKRFKRMVSWCLLPAFVVLCILYGVLIWISRGIEKVIDKFVEFNDCVLMGKKKAGEK